MYVSGYVALRPVPKQPCRVGSGGAKRKSEKPGYQTSEGGRWRPGLTDTQIVLPSTIRVYSADQSFFTKGSCHDTSEGVWEIVGQPCDMKRHGPRLYLPPPKPRAVLSARHASKGAARPQLRNFEELLFSEGG
jgi:hypothetical protein